MSREAKGLWLCDARQLVNRCGSTHEQRFEVLEQRLTRGDLLWLPFGPPIERVAGLDQGEGSVTQGCMEHSLLQRQGCEREHLHHIAVLNSPAPWWSYQDLLEP